jgi:hypothetical protein
VVDRRCRKDVAQVLERGTVITTVEQGQGTQSGRGGVSGNCIVIKCILVLCPSFRKITRVHDTAFQITLAEVVNCYLWCSRGFCNDLAHSVVGKQPDSGSFVLALKVVRTVFDTSRESKPSWRARQLRLLHHNRAETNHGFQVNDEFKRRQSGKTKDRVCGDLCSEGNGY